MSRARNGAHNVPASHKGPEFDPHCPPPSCPAVPVSLCGFRYLQLKNDEYQKESLNLILHSVLSGETQLLPVL